MIGARDRFALTVVNAAMSMFHTALAVTTLLVGNPGLWVPVYATRLNFDAPTADRGFRLVPVYEEFGALPLTRTAALFFACSAVAHAGNAWLWRGFYLRRLGQAQSPMRWLEYFFSAPIMILSIAYAAGVRSHVELLQGYALVATTITFGWLNEVISRPRASTERAFDDAWALPLLPRLQAHLLGYVPQLAAWYGVVFTFLRSATGDGAVCGGPPAFVYYIVLGEALLFFSFGVPQLYQALARPSRYVVGEYVYQVLSLLAKGLLGLTLLVNVLVYDQYDDAIADAYTNSTQCVPL
jgi:hypothetical protein